MIRPMRGDGAPLCADFPKQKDPGSGSSPADWPYPYINGQGDPDKPSRGTETSSDSVMARDLGLRL